MLHGEKIMANLSYCYLKVFGSNFDAEKFAYDMALPDAIVIKRNKAYPKSSIRAIREGNVNYWKTPKKYFTENSNGVLFAEYIDEENFMIDFIKQFYNLKEFICKYKNDTTETWFIAVYKASPNEKPTGVHFGHELIEALHKIEASISTEIVFS
jgi:hypothetical protein